MVEDGHWYLIQVDAASSLFDSALESDEAYELRREWDDTIVDPMQPPEQFKRYLENILRDVFTRDTLLEQRITHDRGHLSAIAESYENFVRPRMRDGLILVDLKLVNMNGLVLIQLGPNEPPTQKPGDW